MTDTAHGSHGPKSAPGPSAPGTPFDDEIDVKRILEIGAWLGAITIAALIVGYFIYRGLGGAAERADPRPSPLPEASVPVTPPAPRLQVRPELDLKALRMATTEQLESWGWVDKGTGVAHMPIDEAISRLAVPEAAPPATPAESVPPAPSAHGSAPAAGSAGSAGSEH